MPGQLLNVSGTANPKDYENALIQSLPDIIYEKETETDLRKIFRALSLQLSHIDSTILAVANNNYISITVKNEGVIRGEGLKDRLINENAYVIDKISFQPDDTLIFQNILLSVGTNTIQLYSIPSSIDFIIVPEGQGSLIGTLPYIYDKRKNNITITSTQSGHYILAYKDVGNVLRNSTKLFVDPEIFLLGYDEGSYDYLGYDE